MEQEGLLRSEHQTTEGRQRRIYRITPAGRRQLKLAKVVLAELADEVLRP
jgi:DNA-binding PadR family transcriptional regulator